MSVVNDLVKNYQHILGTLTLTMGSRGVFDVTVDGQLIYSKHETGRHAEHGEVLDLFRRLRRQRRTRIRDLAVLLRTGSRRMHTFDDETEQLALAIQHWIHERRAKPPNRVGRPVTAAELGERLGNTVTADGIGWREALRIFTDELIPVSNPHDRPINLSFIPTAPTEAACLFDGAVGAAGVIGARSGWLAAASSTQRTTLCGGLSRSSVTRQAPAVFS